MVINDLKNIVDKNKTLGNSEYVRNLLKEKLQIYILNFVYTSKYKDLIFTGGTCLRKFFDLPRISEDLDFNIDKKDFDFESFQNDLSTYFVKKLGFRNFTFKFNNKTIFVKFSILRDIGFAGPSDSDILFLRLDFAFNNNINNKTENRIYTKEGFAFIARCYDINTLFVNKIDAFLNRLYRKGNIQQESFKGRDAFDLVWIINEKKNKGLNLDNITGDLKSKIIDKSKKIKPKELYNDLKNFFEDQNFIRQFCDDYQKLLETTLKYI